MLWLESVIVAALTGTDVTVTGRVSWGTLALIVVNIAWLFRVKSIRDVTVGDIVDVVHDVVRPGEPASKKAEPGTPVVRVTRVATKRKRVGRKA